MVRVTALLLLLPKPKLNPPTIAVVDIDEWAGEEDDDDVELFISFSFSFFPVAGNWKKWKKFQALYQFCRYKQMGQVKMWLESARL